MKKIYVCEDNKEQREYMARIIQELILVEAFPMVFGTAAADPEELLEQIKLEREEGIFFLDIDLQHKMNGMELAQKIREYQPRCWIIFVTTHSEMSYLTFQYKVEALDYIVKDERDALKTRIHQCLLHVLQREKEGEERKSKKKFLVQAGGRIVSLLYDEILYFENSQTKNKMYVYTMKKCMEFQGNMKKIEEEVDERFYRCHRSFLVNLHCIERIDSKENIVYLSGGVECPVSFRLKKGLLEKLQNNI